MSRISCEVMGDLLPLYCDKVCSPDSRALVEEHLSGCAECRELLKQMSRDIALPLPEAKAGTDRNARELEENGLRRIQVSWKRSKTFAFVRGFLLAAAACALLCLVYLGLTEWNVTRVPSKVIQITEVSRLQNGRIAYHVKMTDGYAVNQVKGVWDDDRLYLVPMRPLIKTRKFADISLANTYDTLNLDQIRANRKAAGKSADVRAIYYGPPEEPILLWEQGIELPPASAALEAQFQFE
ncbi:zf-HC2 domain-containing protein [Paenibacillus sp. MBLB2552]|uniref:Anti-sigma-W factor RsiW n=1 Tax=Paenibacillus mellifer TaxID=2937794 RepID=A0A9X2BN75_9BACL|nr:zf-HC2 domain-containing protein [Paenibacillus mellifer]MCK8486544.1 zf-HC2 domain-containing protein [Paenibacillus mellifer]